MAIGTNATDRSHDNERNNPAEEFMFCPPVRHKLRW
jgi:hypothetical protein